MPTKLDVMKMAYRRVGIVAQDEEPTADEYAAAEAVLDGIFAEVSQESPIWWNLDDVPNEAFLPLAMVAAYDLAAAFGVPARESRGYAMARLLAAIRPDDRAEIADAAYY